MDGLALVIAFGVIAALIATLVVVMIRANRAIDRRDRTLREIGDLTAVHGAEPDLVERVRLAAAAAERVSGDAEAARRDRALLIELIGVGIVRLDPRRRIQLANAAAHALLDRPPGSLVGMTATAAFLDARIEAVVDRTARTGAGHDEVQLAGSGTRLTVRARWASSGGMWILLEDVSELRRLQQIRAEFIDNLSHELRTPLTTVSLLAETLVRDAAAAGDAIPARMRDRIGKVEVETGHLVQMVDELLELSRIEGGGPLVLLDEVDLGRLATETTERIRLFAERQGVVLMVEIGPALPPVRGDAGRLAQVLINLLHNAVKFSPDGGVVTVSVRLDGDRVVTAVADHGVGIPRAAQARIFERFYKVDRARARGAGGTGLGLAIARHVVQQHGGSIWVDSGEGVGSTFTFALPVAPPPA